MKNMNKVVMFIWGLIIFGMCSVILMIGYKEQDRDYIKLTKELKQAGQLYIKDNRISASIGDSVVINIDDLIKGQYIEEDKKIEDYCIEGVIFSNRILFDNYDIKINCKNKKIEE